MERIRDNTTAVLRQYQEALRASEARFRNLIEKNADGILVVWRHGEICYANPAAEALLGRPASELVGQLFGVPVSPGETTEIDLVRSGEPAGVAEMRVAEIEWEGQPAFLATLRDVTERKRHEVEAEEAVRRRDEFLAMLAHELRNPLAPILNAAQILRLQVRDGPGIAQAHVVIERQGRLMARLLDDLLDLSRITHGKIELRRELVNLAAALTNATQTSRPHLESRRHHLEVSLPQEPLWVDADPARLEQAFINLLNNAAKYTPEGGQVGVTLWREGPEAVIQVRDNGRGIPPPMLTRIFEPFTQVDQSLDRSQGGLGIGLNLVKRLVELHGGSVRAFSAGPGQGSEFTIRLPLQPSPSAPEPRRREKTSSKPRRVLLIEDNADGRDMLAELLGFWGHHVEVAEDGRKGLERLRDGPPDVALVDIGLPGLDGYEVARAARADVAARGVFLVALTGYGQPADRQRALEAGFDTHLVKPVDLDALARLLDGLETARVCR